MRKLINGIIDFKKNVSPEHKEVFARLAIGQSPDAFFVCCSDSRVAPNVFASTDPGDLFVLRNVGNLIPPCSHQYGHADGCESAAAAIEFAVLNLKVSSIIICGHSECGAMQNIINNCTHVTSPNLRAWLQYGNPALFKMNQELKNKKSSLAPHNFLSQLNVLAQIEHLRSYPIIQERLASKALKLYGWWFDIATTNVYSFNDEIEEFVVFDEKEAHRIIQKL
ncbi:MAG: carbonic anhydrase [Bdellovibrionota bacterium]